MVDKLLLTTVCVCLPVLVGFAPQSDVAEQDLVLFMSLEEDSSLNELELEGLIDDAIAPGGKEVELSVSSVPYSLHERFRKLILAPKDATTKSNLAARVSRTDGNMRHWHIKGYGEGRETKPKWLVLRWKEEDKGGEIVEVVKEFVVAPPHSTDTSSVVQAVQAGNSTLLVRADERWELTGFRMEWGTGDERDSDLAPDEFEPWPLSPRCYLVSVPNFGQYGTTLIEVYNRLKTSDNVPETLVVKAPERPLKLMAIDFDPIGTETEDVYWNRFYTLRIPAIRNNEVKKDPFAWALFPLTTEQKDAYLTEIGKIERETKLRGGGQRAIPAYISESKKSIPYVEISDPLAQVEELASKGMPQPTVIVGKELKPSWYEVPAVAGVDGIVENYARTLRFDAVPSGFQEQLAWVIVVYARPSGNEFRAAQIKRDADDSRSRYAESYEEPFAGFLKFLASDVFVGGDE